MDPDPVCPERLDLDPDPVCPERMDPDPDPVNIRPDPQPCCSGTDPFKPKIMFLRNNDKK